MGGVRRDVEHAVEPGRLERFGVGDGIERRGAGRCGTPALEFAAAVADEHELDRVAEARRLCPAGVRIGCGSATCVAEPSGSFDIVLQSMVFTSILESAVRRQVAQEMLRLVKPGGLINWYDYRINNPRNPDVRAVTRREIGRLFPCCTIDLRRVTLAAPLARQIAPRAPALAHVCGTSPWLCTHYLGVIRRT